MKMRVTACSAPLNVAAEAQQIPIFPILPSSKFFQMCFSSLERRASFEPAAKQKEISEGIMAVYMEHVVRSYQAVPLS